MEKTIYEITWSFGCYLNDKFGNSSFLTVEEAIEVASEFKNNPRSHNEKMSDESVKYWKSQKYTITKKYVATEDIITI